MMPTCLPGHASPQERLLSCVVRLPMSFFDSQPTGRLLNRFTKDTGEGVVVMVCVGGGLLCWAERAGLAAPGSDAWARAQGRLAPWCQKEPQGRSWGGGW